MGHTYSITYTVTVVQLLSCVRLFETPWTGACQAFLYIDRESYRYRYHRWAVVKNSPVSEGDAGLFPGLGRFPGVENGNSLQNSCLENSMDRGTWRVTVHGVTSIVHNWAHMCTRILYIYHIFFIYSSLEEQSGCFLVLSAVNSSVMNIGVHISFRIRVFIFSGYISRSDIAGSYGNSSFSFSNDPRYCFP